ncbi:MAG: Acetyltransferase family protein [Mycobacterium sp.]|nr:Acetyltransferase family protein [Mycobacterium sp.]
MTMGTALPPGPEPTVGSTEKEDDSVQHDLVVREATPDDLETVVALARDVAPGRASRGPAPAPQLLHARFAAALAAPDERLFVACRDDNSVVGMALVVAGTTDELLPASAVHLLRACVAPGSRRRGAGRALVAAALGWADELGAEVLTAGVPPTARELRRSLARLGFGPSSERRVASVAVLRRRLEDGSTAGVTSVTGADHLARRPSRRAMVLRRRGVSGA